MNTDKRMNLFILSRWDVACGRVSCARDKDNLSSKCCCRCLVVVFAVVARRLQLDDR